MPTFWREISQVIFRHVAEDFLNGQEQFDYGMLTRVEELETRMATAEETLKVFALAINSETNDIAQRLDRLMEQVSSLSTGNVSSEDIESVLRPLSERLRGLSNDQGVPVVNGTDVSTNTDPTNSPVATDPSANPAPDAPTDVPTPDPTVNPVDVPVDSQAGSSSNDAEANGTVGVPAVDPNSIPQPQSDATTATDSASVSTTENTNDYSPEV